MSQNLTQPFNMDTDMDDPQPRHDALEEAQLQSALAASLWSSSSPSSSSSSSSSAAAE